MAYGKRIVRERVTRGWTQKELARRAGVNVKSISMIERERQFPRPLIQYAIASVFNLDPDVLFAEEEVAS